MVENGEKSDHPLSLFITRMVSPYGIVEISGDRLVSFKEKPVLDYYINGGVYFSKGEIDFGDFDVGDIEKLCKRVIIVNSGKIILDDSMENLKYHYLNKKIIEVDFVTEKN